MTSPVLLFAGHAAWLLAWSVLFQEGAARCGAGVLPLLRRRPFGPLGRAGAGALLGWSVYGICLLGLAGVGLFRPAPIVAAAAGCVLASRDGLARRLLWWEAAVAARSLAWPWLAAFGLGLAPVLVAAMAPDLDQDSLVYHLGAPWAWLQTGRIVAGDTQVSCYTPLPTDLAHVLPILLDDQRLSKWLVSGALLCGAAFWAERCQASRRPAAAWIGPLLAMSAGAMLMLLNTAKNDVPACMLFFVGAWLTLDGVWIAGTAFLGLALAAKFVLGPQILCWLLFVRPPRRLWRPAAVLLVLASLPWWLRTWSATGNPLYPFGAAVFGGYDWSAENQQVFDAYQRRLWEAGTAGWREVVSTGWLESMWRGNALLLVALPVLACIGRTRRAVLACVAGEMVTLATGHQARYFVASTVVLSCLLAEEIGRWNSWWRTAGVAALAVYALGRIALSPHVRATAWKEALRPAQAVHSGTYAEAIDHLRTLNPRRLISIGDTRLFGLPGRVLYGGMSGETPLTWKIAKASFGAEDIRRRFRQLGARHLLHNYVSVEWTVVPYQAFAWDDRALRVYVEFCKRFLVPVWQSATADYANGGFALLEIRSRSLPQPPATTWFAPGTESVHGAGMAHQLAGRPREALAGFRESWKRLPDVGTSWNLVGHGYLVLQDMPQAYAYLSRFAEQGMMDAANLVEYASALVGTGRMASAERALEEAGVRYPDLHRLIRINQAGYFGQRAQAALDAGRSDEASNLLDRGDALLRQVVSGADPGLESSRRFSAAYLMGLRGEVWLARGDRVKAAESFRDSLALDSATPLSGRWRQLADRPAPRMF